MVAAILPESLDGTTFQTQTGNRLNEALLPPQCETKVTVRDSTPKKKKAMDNAGMCPCCRWYLYILIPFVLAFVILPFIAFFHENAGPHLLSNSKGCTNFAKIYCALFALIAFSAIVLPFSCCAEEKRNELGNVPRAYRYICFVCLCILAFTWCMEYSLLHKDEECVDFVQNTGSNFFWLCCVIYFYFWCFLFSIIGVFILRWLFCCDPDGIWSLL